MLATECNDIPKIYRAAVHLIHKHQIILNQSSWINIIYQKHSEWAPVPGYDNRLEITGHWTGHFEKVID